MAVDDDRIEEWRIEEETVPARGYRLTLGAPDGRHWSAVAGDLFECLIVLRNQIEPLGMRACCNGARRDAWASGMQRDMGRGASVYLLRAFLRSSARRK